MKNRALVAFALGGVLALAAHGGIFASSFPSGGGGGSASSWAQSLAVGKTSGGNSPTINGTDQLIFASSTYPQLTTANGVGAALGIKPHAGVEMDVEGGNATASGSAPARIALYAGSALGNSDGAEVFITASGAAGPGNHNGGPVTITAGAKANAGIEGPITLNAGSGLGLITLNGVPNLKQEATGANAGALTASNAPIAVGGTPYTWFKIVSADGSTVYVPAWK